MVFIDDDIDEIREEWMDIIEFWEVFQDTGDTFMDVFRAEFDLTNVECTNSADLIAWMHDSWGLSLCFG